jgi:polysaccharide deacetylase family protein (PEP-CTERM system associated)
MMSDKPPDKPRVTRLFGSFGRALTVDVEEWYHTCLVPGYIDPQQRPPLSDELDRLLPELLDTFAEAGRSATFFVLGEVAERLPRRVREIAQAGHEVASHGYLHFRACDRSPETFLEDLRRSKKVLEDVTGLPVRGFRAPEWSLRHLASPCLPLVAEAGFLYDSSLAPYPLSGKTTNPRLVSRLSWDGPKRELLEFPPLTLGPYLRIPAGSWPGRLFRPSWVVDAAEEHLDDGGLPVVVIHPWEVSGRPTPGPLKGIAKFCHEAGRLGYQGRFRELLQALPWSSIRDAAALDGRRTREAPARTLRPAVASVAG